MLSKNKVELVVALIALAAGLGGVAYYYYSGQGSFELQKRQLVNSEVGVNQIRLETDEQGTKEITVECDDGSSYDIYLPPGETNYDALGSSKC